MVITIGVGIFRYKRIYVTSYHICGHLIWRSICGILTSVSVLLQSWKRAAGLGKALGGQEILALESQNPGMKHHLTQLLT